MNIKNVIIIIIALIVVGSVGYIVFKPAAPATDKKPVPNTNVLSKTSHPDPKNTTYGLNGDSITLIDGRAEKEIAPNAESKEVTQYFGNEARTDFNGDGIEDVALILTQNSGGSGTFYYIGAVVSSKNGYRGTNLILIGDRIAPQTTEFVDDEIVVNYADRAQGESMTVRPHLGASKYFDVVDGTLMDILK